MPFFENFDEQVTYWTWLILATIVLALEFATSPNGKLIFMPLEASSLIGALGGISELLGEISDKKKGGSGTSKGRVPNTDS